MRARATLGGHDIPDELIRSRYTTSISNLIRLMPRLRTLRVYDNSLEADPYTGAEPQPLLILHMQSGNVIETCRLESAPGWTKPVLETALRLAE